MDAKAPPVISVFMCDKEERLLEIVRLESEMTLKEALAKSIFLRGSCGYISINLVATVKNMQNLMWISTTGKYTRLP
jgi:hypothetical protein